MIREILKEGEERMKGVINATQNAFAAVRTGRANPNILDRITVDYYGTQTPLNQMANISVPEARLLVIQPWDKSTLKEIEKSILASDLGLTPNNDGNLIRIAFPQLTEERRKDLVRVVRKDAEDYKVGVRNIRRDLNESIKDLEKSGDISEDESRRYLEQVQDLTDKYIDRIDQLLEVKEKEILEI